MKLSDLQAMAEATARAIREALDDYSVKFNAYLKSVRDDVEELRAVVLKRDDEINEVRSALNLQGETLRSEIEERLPLPDGFRIKSLAVEGKSLSFEMGDGSTQSVEIPGLDDLRGADGVDGAPGKDGNDGDPGLPGTAGKDGQPGRDGADGKDGVGVVEVKATKEALAIATSDGREYVIELPQPAQPANPIDVKDAMIDREGRLVLVFSDGRTKELGVIIGRDGRDGIDGAYGMTGEMGPQGPEGPAGRDGLDGLQGPEGPAGPEGPEGQPGRDGYNGVDGRDGFGFDDLSVSLRDDMRTVVFAFTKGENVREFDIKFPVSIFRGGYVGDQVYEAGDVVAFGGSTYSAKRETIGVVPGLAGEDSPWVQMTAAGRSMRGERGLNGADGRNGRDLRAFT